MRVGCGRDDRLSSKGRGASWHNAGCELFGEGREGSGHWDPREDRGTGPQGRIKTLERRVGSRHWNPREDRDTGTPVTLLTEKSPSRTKKQFVAVCLRYQTLFLYRPYTLYQDPEYTEEKPPFVGGGIKKL